MKKNFLILGLIGLLSLGGWYWTQVRLAPRVSVTDLAQSLPDRDLKGKIILGFHGTTKDDPEVKDLCEQLKTGTVGGVIFFLRNIVSPLQTKNLIAHLKKASPAPLWIAIDQEGGHIQTLRRRDGFHTYLSPLKVAKKLTPDQAYEHYLALAKELSDIGFNLNFGCVLDLNDRKSPIIGGLDRSYSRDPQIVATYAQAFVQAHQHAGVTPCLKHYPGHGLALQDSHIELTDITLTKQPDERTAFRLMIQKGFAPMIMSAHVIDRDIDPDDPVSLSKIFLSQKLREQDGFKGLIVTDDLHMGAICQNYSVEEAVIKALDAGNDLLIISNNRKTHSLERFYNIARPLRNRLRQIRIFN